MSPLFAENVTVTVVGALVATVPGVLASRPLWRAIRLRLKAATIRKAAGRGFVLVRCPIENDKDDAIGGEIAARIEEAFGAFSALKGTDKAFEVVMLPLRLGGDEGSASFERSVSKAKNWLTKTNGDVLIWGPARQEGHGRRHSFDWKGSPVRRDRNTPY